MMRQGGLYLRRLIDWLLAVIACVGYIVGLSPGYVSV